MVLGEVAAGAAAGASSLLGYNRGNYLYDRTQRQEFEYKLWEWRSTQAELWRDDVREIIGLTEKKMDTYLIVNTLQLGMCIGLFAEGRLEPGTPPWLLHLYMLTLGAAFMYLLMSVWFAMHASIVASCSSVRLLTQFVRLPVPTWEQLEHMRTYAQSAESLELRKLFRVPFTGKVVRNMQRPGQGQGAGGSPMERAGGREGEPEKADPWDLEMHGDDRGLHELTPQPPDLRRHVCLAQRAARQYQSFDAFARVAMSFGTFQLLNALSYYVLGYVAVQDGAPFSACCVVLVMICVALAIVHLDFSMTDKEQHLAKVLIVTGPTVSAAATFAWTLSGRSAEYTVTCLLPIAYAAHGLWLFYALITCGLQLQPNGSVLPMRFRAVLYLDVFGWICKGSRPQQHQPLTVQSERSPAQQQSPERQRDHQESEVATPSRRPSTPQPVTPQRRKAGQERLAELEALRKEALEVQSLLAKRRSSGDFATHLAHLDQDGLGPGTAVTTPLLNQSATVPGPSGEYQHAPDYAFTPSSYHAHRGSDSEDTEIKCGHDKTHPGRLPAKVFRLATMLLIVLWALGLAMPFGVFREFMTKPLTADLVMQGPSSEMEGTESSGRAVVEGHDGITEYSSDIPSLGDGEVLKVSWPSHSGFVPHSLSTDPAGMNLVVADDLGVYTGRLSWVVADKSETKGGATAAQGSAQARSLAHAAAPAPLRLLPVSLDALPTERAPQQILGVQFQHLPPCTALEGQALADIGVVCSEEERERGQHPNCRVVVLHARGRRLAQCPMSLPDEESSSARAKTGAHQRAKPLFTWTITSDWLQSDSEKRAEKVDAFAVNSACMSGPNPGSEALAGCVVVGTTAGRIVQLREAFVDKRSLVPDRAVRQRSEKVSRGSLHIFSNGMVLALKGSSGTVEAFSSQLGTMIGEWRLPRGIDWRMICGGGDSLFALGLRNRTHAELHRFQLPADLKVGPVQGSGVQSLQGSARVESTEEI